MNRRGGFESTDVLGGIVFFHIARRKVLNLVVFRIYICNKFNSKVS